MCYLPDCDQTLRVHIIMEDDLWWKKTFDGRRPLMENNLWWKTTFDGRWPLMEDIFLWETSFDGTWPLMEDYLDLWWMTTFDGRQSFMEDSQWLKMTFNEWLIIEKSRDSTLPYISLLRSFLTLPLLSAFFNLREKRMWLKVQSAKYLLKSTCWKVRVKMSMFHCHFIVFDQLFLLFD